jgi:hypothetical protein
MSSPPPMFAPGFGPAPYQPRPAPVAWQQPAPPRPRPVVRAQAPDEPVPAARPVPTRPTLLTLPSPEALGLAPGKEAATDWAAVHRRLDRVGATCFHVDKLPQGGYRVTCLMPGSTAGSLHHVESQAANEAEALQLALARAEQWAVRK